MTDEKDGTAHYEGAEGGWGSARGIIQTALRERPTKAKDINSAMERAFASR